MRHEAIQTTLQYCVALDTDDVAAGLWQEFENRQDFSHREADGKSLLDEVLRRGRGERWGAGWNDGWDRVG